MNKYRRQRLEEAIAAINEARSIIEECLDEEQEAYDNLPESLQDSEKGEPMQEAIDAMESYLDDSDTANLEEACGIGD